MLAPASPFFPLGAFFAGAFLVLGSEFGGAGLADNLADLLCGYLKKKEKTKITNRAVELLKNTSFGAKLFWTPGTKDSLLR